MDLGKPLKHGGGGVLWELLRDRHGCEHEMATCQPRIGLGRVQESVLTIAFLASGTVQGS